jgi:hypothetical protein
MSLKIIKLSILSIILAYHVTSIQGETHILPNADVLCNTKKISAFKKAEDLCPKKYPAIPNFEPILPEITDDVIRDELRLSIKSPI